MAKGSADEFGRPAPESPGADRRGRSRALAFAVGLASVLAVAGVVVVVVLILGRGQGGSRTGSDSTTTTRASTTTTTTKMPPAATQPVVTTEPPSCGSYVWRADQLAGSVGYEGLLELSDQIADLMSQARADGCSATTVAQIQKDYDSVQGMQRTS